MKLAPQKFRVVHERAVYTPTKKAARGLRVISSKILVQFWGGQNFFLEYYCIYYLYVFFFALPLNYCGFFLIAQQKPSTFFLCGGVR